MLTTLLRDDWCGPPTPEKAGEWLNLNSFTARITSEGLIDGSILGLWEIREALEEENSTKAIANCNISVASEWIIRSGTKLYSEVLNAAPLDESEARATMGGDLYKGQAGFCQERWDFWKFRLSMVNKDDVDEDAAKMAQQTVKTMTGIEKAMEKRDMDLFTSRDSSGLYFKGPVTL